MHPDAHEDDCVDQSLPLSYGQRALWSYERLHPTTVANHLVFALNILSELDVPAFTRAAQLLVDRHPMLRATFEEKDGLPVQTVHQHLPVSFRVESAADWSDAQVSAFVSAEAERPFDLRNGHLVRFLLLTRSPTNHVWLVSTHHLVTDLWSIALMLHELTKLYRAVLTGESAGLRELTSGYEDYVERERRMVSGDADQGHSTFWREYLDGAPAAVRLPRDLREAPETDHGRESPLALDAEATAALKRVAAAHSATLHEVVVLGFLTLLNRYTGEGDLVIGTIAANRSARQARTVGCFVNPVALRVDVSDSPSFSTVIDRVHRSINGRLSHTSYPFPKLAEELRLGAERPDRPYFSVMFSWDRTTSVVDPALTVSGAGAAEGIQSALHDLRVAPMPLDGCPVPGEILLRAGEIGQELHLTIDYKSELFAPDTIAQLGVHLRNLLSAAVSDASRGVGELELLSEGERSELEELAGAVEAGPVPALGEAIREQVSATPDAVAVRFGKESLTYAELDSRANRLARHLRASGVGPGVLVGVWMKRSVEMLVAVLATMRSGGAFLPLDPGFPLDRIRFMVTDSKAKVVVTDSELLAGGELAAGVDYVCVDCDAERIGRQSAGDLDVVVGGEDLAYVIYTSGSTGRPKGVQVEHRSLADFVQAMVERPGVRSSDVVLSVTTLSFDPSLLELLVPLVVGAQVVIVDSETASDGAALAAVLTESGATIMQSTPSRWRLLIEAGWLGEGRLKALCGGEAMSRDLADQLLARCGSVWNIYGPTETTVWSTVEEVRAGDGPVPIGAPVDNNRLYVLDANLQLLPIGVPGELVIGGSGVARGYLGRPELTAERFLPDPFGSEPGARMYRTGDLVRRRRSGDLEFLGRIDQQVKVRGYRIEPGEIESVLARHPAVAQAVVTAYQHAPGDTRLAAYYTLTEPTLSPPAEELRSHLRGTLPDYMVPSAYRALEAFPSTPTNKIDRARLPAPESTPTHAGESPRPGLETELARIWEGVLGTPGIGRDDDFFDLGGHSLLATRLFAEVEALTGRRPPLSILFRAPTIACLAAALQADVETDVVAQGREPGGKGRVWTSLVPVQAGGDRTPFFYVSPFLISALSFSQLGRYLGSDQPLYILQPQGMESDQPFHTSVEEMAAHYIEEMKEVQPRGPYRIGGHCAGSWVAFEMARQLEQQGEDLGLVVLVDSPPPGMVGPEINPCRYLARRMADFWRDGRLIHALRWQMKIAADRVVVGRFGRRGGTARRIAKLRSVHAAAHRSYTGGTLRGDALLVRSSEYARLRSRDCHLDWAKLLSGDLHTAVVPSTHSGLSTESEPLARVIRGALNEAAEPAGGVSRPASQLSEWGQTLTLNGTGALSLNRHVA